MGKNAKLGIAAGVVLVVAILMYSMVGMLFALAVLVLGGLGIFRLKDMLPDDEYEDEPSGGATKVKKGKPLKGKKGLDALLEKQNDPQAKTKKRPVTPPTAPSSGEGLPTWGGGLDTWTPPSGDDIEVVEDEETASSSDWDSWDSEWSEDGGTDTLEVSDPLGNLDELEELDDVDPIAEVERIDALQEDDDYDPLGGLDDEDTFDVNDFEIEEVEDKPAKSAFSFGSAPAVINEHVETADDIMAASQATELHAEAVDEDAADSELAKLLAKVQARLAAYE